MPVDAHFSDTNSLFVMRFNDSRSKPYCCCFIRPCCYLLSVIVLIFKISIMLTRMETVVFSDFPKHEVNRNNV
jgi:hypothetical protein